jgi:hypothetical protein
LQGAGEGKVGGMVNPMTEELGLTGGDGTGTITAFTLECWIRVRIINPSHGTNNFLEIGRGDPIKNENQIIKII